MLGENLLPIGVINKVGTPVNEKQTYELTDTQRHKKYTYIVPQENADKFEKLYEENNAVMDDVNNPETQEKLRQQGLNFGKKLKNITLAGTITGAVIPAAIAIFTKGKVWKRTVFGVISSLAGAALGAWGATYLGVRLGLQNMLRANEGFKKLESISKQVDELGVERKSEDIIA